MSNNVWCWSLSPSKYVQEAVRNCQNHLKENYSGEYKLIANAPNPFPLVYEPEMYVSPLLLPDEASYYHNIIGVMRWMVKLGSVDISIEMSQISSFLPMPRKGNMVSDLQMMYYLRIRHNSCFVLDPSYADINLSEFNSDKNWTAFYGYFKESKLHNAPKPLGKKIEVIMFVDFNNAGDNTNCCSCTGYMIFMNMSMIYWHTKKQATVEGAVFGSEFFFHEARR